MTVGLMLITHNRIGDELLGTALRTLNGCPLTARIVRVYENSDPEELLEEAHRLTGEADSGEGILVLTDIYGSTPSNIAVRLLDSERVCVVAGLNLPMLIRVLNYARLSLPELANKAVSGGREGIVLSSWNERSIPDADA